MLIIIIIRIAIWLTFILTVAIAITVMIWFPRFAARYERRHKVLEADIEALKRRVEVLEK